MVLDTEFLIDALMEAGKTSVGQGLTLVQGRARMHAPVRDIFRHGRGKATKLSSPRAANLMASWSGVPVPLTGREAQRAGHRTLAARSPSYWSTKTGRQIIVSESNTSRGFIGSAQATVRRTEAYRAGSAAGIESGKQKRVTVIEKFGGTIRGRPNSYAPVVKSPGGYIGGEELRHWGGPGVLEIKQVQGRGGAFKLADLLSSRGRYELKSGRAVVSTTGKSGEATMTVGGRLRESIQIEGPFINGDEVYGFVRASAADPGSSHNYARDQEFGSRHNRAHPFLRPGLRESKAQIVDLERGVIARALAAGARPSSSDRATIGVDVDVVVTWSGFRKVRSDLHAMFPEASD